MTNRAKSALSAQSVSVAVALGLARRRTRPRESPAQRAVRPCGECGLAVQEVQGLVETMQCSPDARDQKLEALYVMFEQRTDAEPCMPCAEAVLDAAERR